MFDVAVGWMRSAEIASSETIKPAKPIFTNRARREVRADDSGEMEARTSEHAISVERAVQATQPALCRAIDYFLGL
ncbi:MAG TPA: hypothetical protein VH867_01380 [Burkholderiales bacterium]|jgi:hypothetical protein